MRERSATSVKSHFHSAPPWIAVLSHGSAPTTVSPCLTARWYSMGPWTAQEPGIFGCRGGAGGGGGLGGGGGTMQLYR